MTPPPALAAAASHARPMPRPKTGSHGRDVGGVGGWPGWLRVAAFSLAFANSGGTVARAVELVGVLGSPEGHYVALRLAPDQPARWLRVGERWANYGVLAYDRAREVAVLQIGSELREYVLRRASWPDGTEAFSAAAGAAAARSFQLQQRAAYQHFFDTGTTPPVTFALSFPVHIVVPSELALPDIARRLHTTLEHLAALNPDFEPAAPGGPKHTVRVR